MYKQCDCCNSTNVDIKDSVNVKFVVCAKCTSGNFKLLNKFKFVNNSGAPYPLKENADTIVSESNKTNLENIIKFLILINPSFIYKFIDETNEKNILLQFSSEENSDYHHITIDKGVSSATISYYDNNNNLNRESGEATLVTYDLGKKKVTSSYYHKKGRAHREGDLPAFVADNYVQYFIDDCLHRDNDLPAIIARDDAGNITAEYWYKNGQFNRESGPAVITYSNNKIISADYYINGEKYSKSKFLKITKKERDSNGMSDNSFFNMVKSDGVDAAYRVAASQMTSAIKSVMLSMLEKQGQNKQTISAFSDLLDSKAGEVIIAMALGFSLPYIPPIAGNEKAERLAKEFRISGMANGANAIINEISQFAVPALKSIIDSLPSEEMAQLRVSSALQSLPDPVELTVTEPVSQAKSASNP
jgi:hypothetical protein